MRKIILDAAEIRLYVHVLEQASYNSRLAQSRTRLS